MTNSTDVYWDINGVSLQTLAFNVQSIASKYRTPKMRGSDRQYAYQHGQSHRRRWADAGSVTLAMWVIGQNEDGTVDAARRFLFHRNMKKLQGLFTDVEGGEFLLTKRWQEEAGGGIIAATGRGILPDGMDPSMEGGPYRAKFVAEVLMADPFFYGAEVTVPVPLNTDVVIDNPGDAASSAVTIDFTGQLANPVLTNLTPTPQITARVGTAIAAGDAVHVDVHETVVTRQNDGANIIGTLSHSGSRPWFEIRRGLNTVRLSADSGTGSAVLKYRPVWY